MPQRFHVVRCFDEDRCGVFQVDQVKKVNTFKCKVCGHKQSVRKVYAEGGGAELRAACQRLNERRGELSQARDDAQLCKLYAPHHEGALDAVDRAAGTAKGEEEQAGAGHLAAPWQQPAEAWRGGRSDDGGAAAATGSAAGVSKWSMFLQGSVSAEGDDGPLDEDTACQTAAPEEPFLTTDSSEFERRKRTALQAQPAASKRRSGDGAGKRRGKVALVGAGATTSNCHDLAPRAMARAKPPPARCSPAGRVGGGVAGGPGDSSLVLRPDRYSSSRPSSGPPRGDGVADVGVHSAHTNDCEPDARRPPLRSLPGAAAAPLFARHGISAGTKPAAAAVLPPSASHASKWSAFLVPSARERSEGDSGGDDDFTTAA